MSRFHPCFVVTCVLLLLLLWLRVNQEFDILQLNLSLDKVAIKVLDKMHLDLQTQRMLSREVSTMESLYHQNVLRLFEVVETPARLYLVLEYAEGGDLYSRIVLLGKLSDLECKLVFAQILSAVKHMVSSTLHFKHLIDQTGHGRPPECARMSI